MESMVLEYVLNAMWQLPLLVLGTALLLRVWRMEPAAQHGVWMGVLALAAVLPLHGLSEETMLPRRVLRWERAMGVASPATEVRPVAQEHGRCTGTPAPGGETDARGGAAGAGGPGMESRVATGEQMGRRLADVPGRGGLQRVTWAEVVGRGRAWRAAAWTGAREVPVGPVVLLWLERVYGLLVLLAGVRVVRAAVLARRLVQRSRAVVMGAVDEGVLRTEAARVGVPVPEVRASDEVQLPAVVGVWRPMLLLPVGFGACSAEERRAALCHELAHVSRWDGLWQALSEVLALPVGWHPAVGHRRWGIKARLRQTREMACDQMAAEGVGSATAYARCLVLLARRQNTPRWTMAVTGMADGVLDERVTRLVAEQRREGVRMELLRAAVGALVGGAMLGAVAGWHVRPVRAEAARATHVGEEVSAVVSAGVSAGLLGGRAEAMPGEPQATGTAPAATPNAARTKAAANQSEGARQAPATANETADGPAVGGEENGRVRPGAEEFTRKMTEPQERLQQAQDRMVARMAEQQSRRSAMTAQEQERLRREMARLAERMNSPEFRAEVERAQKEGMDAARRAQMEAMAKGQEAMRQRMAEMSARLNSPEFRAQMEQAERAGMEEASRAWQDGLKASHAAMEEATKQASAAAERARKDGMRAIEQQRAEADRDRCEAQRSAEREHAEAQKEAEQDQRQAQKEAERGRREAQQEAERDRKEAQREAERDWQQVQP